MKNYFPIIELRKIASIKGGKRVPKGKEISQRETNHPYIRARDIKEGRITFDDPVYLPSDIAGKMSRYTVNKGDICITIVGANIGDVGVVPHFLDGANLTENAVKVIAQKGTVQTFLKYALLTKNAQDQMKTIAGGAAQPKLGIYKIETVEIPYPPSNTQKKIAAILSAYDDLIENNLRRIKILEESAQTVYQEWFVKFCFPGYQKVKMVDLPLGKIPEGWEVRKLGDEVVSQKGRKPKEIFSKYAEGMIPHLLIDYLRGGTAEYAKKDGMVTAAEDDTVMVMDGSGSCDVFIGFSGAVGSTLGSYRTRERGRLSPYGLYLYLLNRKDELKAKNVGAAVPHANKDYINKLEILIPGIEFNRKFEEQIGPLFFLRRSLRAKNSILRQTRDLLLPKLISGELDVSELDIKIPEVNS